MYNRLAKAFKEHPLMKWLTLVGLVGVALLGIAALAS